LKYYLEEDSDELYRETMQELMLELKIKTEIFLKKFKEQNKRVKFKV